MKRPIRIIISVLLTIVFIFEFRQAVLEVDAAWTIPSLGSFMQNQTIDPVAQVSIPSTAQDFRTASKWFVLNSMTTSDLLRLQNTTLVTFWNKDCVTCMQMIPTFNAWQKKYGKKGFTIVSIYEPTQDDSIEEVTEITIATPVEFRVGYDADGLIRQSYGAEIWPANYLFDASLNLVQMEFGDRGLEEMEAKIRELIGWNELDENPVVVENPDVDPGYLKKFRFDSPETMIKDDVGYYSFPISLEPKHFALSGGWIMRGEEVEATEKDAAIRFRFSGSGVRAALDFADYQQHFPSVKIDGRYLTEEEAGKDVSVATAVDGRSYITVSYYLTADIAKLVDGDHVLEIIADAPGMRVHFLSPTE